MKEEIKELNAHIGYLLTMLTRKNKVDAFSEIQEFLATEDENTTNDALLNNLEAYIRKFNQNNANSKPAIPGGHRAAAYAYLCSSKCELLSKKITHQTTFKATIDSMGLYFSALAVNINEAVVSN